MSNLRFCRTLTVVFFVAIFLCPDLAAAAEQGGGYLSYQEPKPAGSTWLSTLAYLLSLLLTFALVIALAYFASRFLGQKIGRFAATGDNKVLLSLPLGANRGIYVVEVAGKVLILGVTDHSVNLLQEITDPAVLEKLRAASPPESSRRFDAAFHRHLASLQQMSARFPGVFGQYNRADGENDREKR